MTREVAIDIIKKYDINGCGYCHQGGDEVEKALDMAIKALDEQSILDKIRAEIENRCGLLKENHCKYCSYCNSVIGVREILEIIDKYKAESEE